ncbi:permease-like cell division protein FtsX [Mycetocola spongiae]|uniref:permease-like cell division protein FtsX n=1 Tax=Mycetocola spongiae TaxID=2859226 RepID=UPI001CF11CB8|nr:permease-like cell division protein FtsX [Mycetocola spongiae]UCR89100.1 permease-like cell division protein FtsX [Mycetocola spongiae]
MRVSLIWSEVFTGLRRNLSMVVSVILVTFISLTFVGAAALMQMQITQMKGYWYDRAQVAIYLCPDNSLAASCAAGGATDDQREAVENTLKSAALSPLIDKYYFESKDDAFTRFQEKFAGNEIAQFVTPDQLQETFWVNLKNPAQSDVIGEAFSSVPGVEEVTDQRKYLDVIFNILNVASYTAIGIAGLMLVAAVLLIATTIRLSAYSRRREITIMRLVGASNRFIQTPFILEGVFSAFIGSLLAGGAVVGIVHFFVQGYLRDNVPAAMSNLVGVGDALLVVPVLILIGMILAALSANFAIRRYLKA